MVKVNPSITLELKSGQKISISLEEGKELIRGLSKFVEIDEKSGVSRRGSKNSKAGTGQKRRVPGMSKAKEDEILRHVEKKLSSKPRTLSNLLTGISYMPNHLPMIRRLVESQPGISKKT
ncbi:MAG TPA: hypothetical protein VEA37_11685, partial [Flavobacterium sp.]|nr:hypothetical protein [Flavobacterium sp.]